MPTTYVDRRNTNQRVYQIASQVTYPAGEARIKPFTETLDARRTKLAGHILRTTDRDPMRQVTYQSGSANPIHIGKRRIGRPRQQWTFRSNELMHNKISHTDYEGFECQNANIYAPAPSTPPPSPPHGDGTPPCGVVWGGLGLVLVVVVGVVVGLVVALSSSTSST